MTEIYIFGWTNPLKLVKISKTIFMWYSQNKKKNTEDDVFNISI